MEISAFDEGFRTPSAEAHLTAIRTQQILSIETGVAKVADPLGGSYFIKSLTDEIEARISAMVGEIEAAGDPIELAERGYFRAIFNRASERHARALASGEHQVVGVNCHEISRSEDTLLRDIAERKIAPYRQQIEKVSRFRAERDQEPVRRALRHVHAQAKIRDAQPRARRSSGTAGWRHDGRTGRGHAPRLRHAVRPSWGLATRLLTRRSHRASMTHRAKIIVGLLGIDQHEVGAIAISSLLRDAGVEVIYLGRFNTPASLIRVALHEDADVIGVSCHSWEYLEYIPELMTMLRSEAIDVDVVLGGSVITVGDAETMRQAGGRGDVRRRTPSPIKSSPTSRRSLRLDSNACAAIHASEPSATRPGAIAHSWRER